MSPQAASLADADPLPAAAASAHAFSVHAFSVQAWAEPGVMPRVLELFAKRGLVPSRWHSAVDGERLTIDVQMRGLERDKADYIAACLRQLAYVEVVLTSQMRAASPLSAG